MAYTNNVNSKGGEKMTKKEATQKARKIAQMYGAWLEEVEKDEESNQWIGFFEEHGEKFYCELGNIK